ncbi:protein gurken [Anastrepha ludens]|uniref:protein gurken n=1 Tax=Anastrepha ludens TaxID=28586 RepID=UPI0023B0C56E|nr:protein gurken [Anastrepha ludens]
MQISENLLRVIFMLSTIVAVTDCCSSRLLLLKEHTLQIVQQHRQHSNINSDEYDYDNDDYDQLQKQHQQQLEQQQQQQQKIPQYVDIANSELEFNKNYTDEHTRSRDNNEEKSTDRQILGGAMELGNFGSDSFESLLGIFDAAAFETTTTATTTTAKTTTTATTEKTKLTPTTTTTTTRDTTTLATTTAAMSTQRSSTSKSLKSSSQSGSTLVVAALSGESSSTRTNTATAAATTRLGGMESVMNDLKTVRDLLKLPCSGQFNVEFCLNRGRCFRYPIGNETIHSCICADGYVGERCESKSMNGSYIPSIAGANKKQKIRMARIVFSFPMLVALSVIYIMIGAAILFKRPSQLTPAPMPSSRALSTKEQFELFEADDDAGEFIMLNSYPIAARAASYSAYTD